MRWLGGFVLVLTSVVGGLHTWYHLQDWRPLPLLDIFLTDAQHMLGGAAVFALLFGPCGYGGGRLVNFWTFGPLTPRSR
jgi:hypothetical protein